MLELGAASGELHRAAGEEAARADVSELVAVGGANARAVADGALKAGMPASQRALRREQHRRPPISPRRSCRSGDVVLVKGSRGIRTEVVVDRLKAEFA